MNCKFLDLTTNKIHFEAPKSKIITKLQNSTSNFEAFAFLFHNRFSFISFYFDKLRFGIYLLFQFCYLSFCYKFIESRADAPKCIVLTSGYLNKMNIRIATNADSEEVKKLIFSVLEEYGLKPDSQITDKDLDDIEGFYINNGGYFGVIEEDDLIGATVGIYKMNSETCELRKMYSYQNQRGKGLGIKLMDFSISKAKELGFSRMILETASPLKEAISLYKKYGFTEIKADHLSSRCDQAFELNLS